MSNIFNTEPADDPREVTPSDTVDLVEGCRALYIGVGGDVSLIAAGKTTPVLFKNCASGSVLPVKTGRVRATGTTATNIVALL